MIKASDAEKSATVPENNSPSAKISVLNGLQVPKKVAKVRKDAN